MVSSKEYGTFLSSSLMKLMDNFHQSQKIFLKLISQAKSLKNANQTFKASPFLKDVLFSQKVHEGNIVALYKEFKKIQKCFRSGEEGPLLLEPTVLTESSSEK